MIHPEKIHAALSAKQSHFVGAQRAKNAELKTFQKAIIQLADLDLNTAKTKLAPIERPGARPTLEFDQHERLIVPFDSRWSNHEQARTWAKEILEGVPIFAVDGSQIAPTKDVSIPIGLIQIGWFENRHRVGGEYVKDLAVEVLSPAELEEGMAGSDDLGGAVVNLRRFQMETRRISEYLRKSAGAIPNPLALFDGTLIVSFAGLMQPKSQSGYTRAVLEMLEASNASQIPLLGYVDSSSSHDLVDMIGHLTETHPHGQINDAALLQGEMGWGDRSQIFICARDDNLSENDYYESVCFCYLKTSTDLPPARVEFPRWLFESGEHDRVLNLLRAECIIGTGYPYALETADAVAVIDLQDRERFYRLVQRFAGDAGLPYQFTRKSTSKRIRR
jgi:hypothetical protein